MPATRRSVGVLSAVSVVALTAGLCAPAALADDGSGGPPVFFMTWDASGDSLDPFSYDPGQYGVPQFGTFILGGPAGPRERTGWRYQGVLNGESWGLEWDCVVNADPFVDATINVVNNSLSTQTFWVYMPLTISPPIGPATVMDGSVSAVVSDQNADGATLGTTATDPVYRAYIDPAFAQDPSAVVQTLWNPGYSLSAGSFSSNNDTNGFSNVLGPAANNQIAILLRFTLSPGDSASVTGIFEVQIPGPAGVVLLAGGMLIGRRRRR